MTNTMYTAQRVSLAAGPWAEISLSNLTHNLQVLKNNVPGTVHIVPVVKANAYGHGMIRIATHLEQVGVDGFCVATASEGEKLRQAGISVPVFVLTALSEKDIEVVICNELTPAVMSYEIADLLDKAASSSGRPIAVHLRVDVGLGSMGVPYFRFESEMRKIMSCSWLKLSGIFTQLAAAYSNDRGLLEEQIERFEQVLTTARELGLNPELVHAASSPAIVSGTPVLYDMIRPGILLYGLPFGENKVAGLKTVMSIKTRVMEVNVLPGGETMGYKSDMVLTKKTMVASLALGYADALYLHYGRGLEVLIRGKRAPILGHAYMDHVVVDVTEITDIVPGDEAVLLGAQGSEEIGAEELAVKTGVGIANSDCLCLLNDRVQRVYLDDENLEEWN